MAESRVKRVLHALRLGGSRRDGGDLSDGELLRCFLAGREQIAFEALVRRHGPMVLGVCRRLLGHTPDADDAFLATFLVLAHKATAVWPRAKAGNWLYGVAYRIALKARAGNLKLDAGPSTLDQPTDKPSPEWLLVVDREVYTLPGKFRAPLILCDLQGKTPAEAARQLGWREGALSARLSKARLLLSRRLARRGTVVSIPNMTSALNAHGVPAELPAALVDTAARAAHSPTIQEAASAGVISAKVAALTERVLKTMMWTNLKAGVVLVVALALVATGLASALFAPSVRTDASKPAVTKVNPDPGSAKIDADPRAPTPVSNDRLQELLNAPVDVFLDSDTHKAFIKGARYAGMLDLGGRRFLVFTSVDERCLIDFSRIVALRVHQAPAP